MSKRPLSEQFRDQLNSLGQSLAEHSRSLGEHFMRREQALTLQQQELAEEARLLLPTGAASTAVDVDHLLGFPTGDFSTQTVKKLKALCKENKIRGYSRLRKHELIACLEAKGVTLPPRNVTEFSRAELEQIAEAFFTLIRQHQAAP